MDVEEVKTKENPEVKITEVVDDTRENPAELVRLVHDLFYNDGGPWYR